MTVTKFFGHRVDLVSGSIIPPNIVKDEAIDLGRTEIRKKEPFQSMMEWLPVNYLN